MRTYRLALAIVAMAAAAACGDPRRSMSGLTPLPGDAERGRAVFVEMRCNACHRVAGEDVAAPVAEPEVPVMIGGRITRAVTDGALADSIVNPSHRIAYDSMPGVRAGALSRMPDYTDAMTVRELADLIAFLQTRYEVVEPPIARY
jgi:mono/diheme cytochrome c family protein